jgi:hypothetical protein
MAAQGLELRITSCHNVEGLRMDEVLAPAKLLDGGGDGGGAQPLSSSSSSSFSAPSVFFALAGMCVYGACVARVLAPWTTMCHATPRSATDMPNSHAAQRRRARSGARTSCGRCAPWACTATPTARPS